MNARSNAVGKPDFLGAPLDYAFDFPRIAAETLACAPFFVDTPPYPRQVEGGLSGEIPFMSESVRNYRRIDTYSDSGIRRNGLPGARIFYLRNSHDHDVTRASSFRVTKGLNHSSWYWRPELRERIPYTIDCIESLPYRVLGLIRAFVCENTFMPTHRDTVPAVDGAYDRSRALGISLIPATGGVGMLIWDEASRAVRELHGHCLLFDDSKWHGVPMTQGTRITLRIFGELDPDRVAARLAARSQIRAWPSVRV